MEGRLPLVALAVAASLAPAGCGGGDPDADRIRAIVKDVAEDTAALCDHATSKLLALLGGSAKVCRTAARGYESTSSYVSGDIAVKVSGDSATADFRTGTGTKRHVTFVRRGDDWLVDTIAGG